MGFAEFVGNERIVTALRGMLRSERVPHAMLFAGPRGVGKFTLARMFAQAANCERLKDDFCGECGTCRSIAQLQNTTELVEQGLSERGESPDSATVERVPLLLQTHPDVWGIVPDPIRLRTPVVRPILHVGQLRAVQRAAYFKPIAKRRVFIIDGAETMRWDHANIFLKILEEPPESATLILLAPNAYTLLTTIRSRCVQFFFSPLGQEQVEEVLRRERADLPAGQRKIAAQMAEGSPGVALNLNLEEAGKLRESVFAILAATIERRPAGKLFADTAALVKSKNVPFEIVMELFYSFLNDLLELSAGLAGSARNPAFSKEFGKLSRHIDTAWVIRAVEALDELSARLRRNVNRQLGLDAIAMALAEDTKK